jgi:hypothetical protein
MSTRHVIMLVVSMITAATMVFILLRFLRRLKKLEDERWGGKKD